MWFSLQHVQPEDFHHQRLLMEARVKKKARSEKKSFPTLNCLSINGQNQTHLSDAKHNQIFLHIRLSSSQRLFLDISTHSHYALHIRFAAGLRPPVMRMDRTLEQEKKYLWKSVFQACVKAQNKYEWTGKESGECTRWIQLIALTYRR